MARSRSNPAPVAVGEDGEIIFADPQVKLDTTPRWTVGGNAFWEAHPATNQLPPGLYKTAERSGVGICFSPVKVDTDSLYDLPGSASKIVIDEIRQFWGMKAQFTERGFIWKRGVLLWGPPGSGKTATLELLVQMVIKEHKGIGFFIENPGQAAQLLQMLRRVEPDRPVVCLLEDLDALVRRHSEVEFLSLLDGEMQVSNVVFVGTTNYPNLLDRRFVDRPSRFDTVIYIGMPGKAARRSYLQRKEKSLEGDELERWVEETAGLSIAHIRELIILVKCYNKSFEDAIERLRVMHARKLPDDAQDGESNGVKMGFMAAQWKEPSNDEEDENDFGS
jgi:ATPase family associated with various cellular activities (AAA)